MTADNGGEEPAEVRLNSETILDVPVSVDETGTYDEQRARHADMLVEHGLWDADARLIAVATVPWLSHAEGTFAQFDALRAARIVFTKETDPATRTAAELRAAAVAGLRALMDAAESVGLDVYADFFRDELIAADEIA